MVLTLDDHPRWNPTDDRTVQSRILPGTEDGERIRINSFITIPEKFEELEDVLICQAEGTEHTIHTLWVEASEKYSENNCLGDRRHGGPDFQWKTYGECKVIVDKVATCIVKDLGQAQSNDVRIGMFAGNSWEWTLTGHAVLQNKQVMVPLYDTLGPQAMRFITNLCEFEVIFTDTEARFKAFVNEVYNHEDGYKVKHIVCFSKLSDEVRALADDNLKIHDFTSLLESVTDCIAPCPPSQDDVLVINFTSGTTGDPKGVVLTHKNWISDMHGCVTNIKGGVLATDSWLSYLPAAHVFERMMQLVFLSCGASIGYFGGDTRNLVADAGALRPTVFGAVPRVWNKIYGKLQAAQNESFIKNKLIGWALRNKMKMVQNGIDRNDTIYDKIVFKKIQALLGGRVRFAACAAAPIKNEVLNSVRAALGCVIHEGYGQTETCAASTLTVAHDSNPSVGPPLACTAIKLDSVPEMNYLAKDDMGEICMKGFNVMSGYYKNKEKTAETIDKDGWIHTGDIGRWNADGTLSIIDRKKHIFKLAQGEYIAPEKIENVYITHPAIAQCFLYGESLRTTLIAMVFPDPDGGFASWATRSGFKGMSFDELCVKKEVVARLLAEMRDVGKGSNLFGFEQVKAIQLIPKLMSVEDDLLTPTMKAKRPQITKWFKEKLDVLYATVPE